VVTVKTQYNLKKAKEYFEEHLCVGEYYDQGQQVAPVLRGRRWRNPGDNDGTTRHLLGRSVRVLAFGLAFVISSSRMTTRERGAGFRNPNLDQTTFSVLVSVLVS
jgi:hypothetical protein